MGAWRRVLDQLARDNRSGATALARLAAGGLTALHGAGVLGDEGRLRAELRALATVRPPFGPLLRIANRAALDGAEGADAGARARAIEQLATSTLEELQAQHGGVVRAAESLLRPGGARRVMTISASSLLRDVLLTGTGPDAPAVVCLESRPGLEGTALARDLAAFGYDVRVAADCAAARLVSEVDLVLVGGDTLSPRGLIHKVGTFGLAQAAREAGVPFFALVGTLKCLPAPVRGWDEDGGPPEELVDGPVGSLEVWNRYYDCTPLHLLAGVVTEDGVLPAERAAATVVSIHPWLADLLER